jgi:hypothetical protein
MGDANTGTGYGYLLYALTPELQKKYITEESDPDILKRDGFEKVFERFLNAEPPNYKALRVANKEASDKEKASWKDFDPYKVRPEGEFDESRSYTLKKNESFKDYLATLKTPAQGRQSDGTIHGRYINGTFTPAFENPYVLPTAQQIADKEAYSKAFKDMNAYDVNDYRSYQASYLNKLNTPNVDTKDFEKLITNEKPSTPTPTPTPNVKDFETLLANQGPSTPIKYYQDLNKGKGGYAPDPSAIPTNVRLKNPPLASDTQEVDIAAGDKDPFLNKADQLLGDLKASKDAQTAERRRTKRDNTGDLAETTALLENLNFFGDDESSGDPSLIAAEYRPTPSPEPVDRLSPNMRGARNYGRENPGTYNPFLTDQVNRHFMGLPARGV